MRSGFDTPEERWLLLRCGRATRSGHDHADWNAFSLYAFGIPLALDSAAGAYSDPMNKKWNVAAVSHNTVVFGDRSQERRDASILAWASTAEADYSVSDAAVPAGVKKYIRHVLFVKPEYFVIWDEIDAKEPTKWMLHTTATNFKWDTHKVRCETPWNVDLDVHAVWPATPLVPGTAKGKFGSRVQSDEENTNNDKGEGLPFSYQEYFGIPNQPGKDFLVVLHPLRRGQSSLKVEDVGRPGNPVLRITNGTQVDTVELAATSAIINRQGPEKGRLVIRATQPVVPDELQ